MKPANPRILTINGGSSSIKFTLYLIGEPLARTLAGKIDRIGLSGMNLTFSDMPQGQQNSRSVEAEDHHSAANFLIDWLAQHVGLTHVMAVGHRVVHGMQHTEPECVSQALLDMLRFLTHRDQAF